MDFFEHQENAKQASRRLLLLFAFGCLTFVAVVFALARLLLYVVYALMDRAWTFWSSETLLWAVCTTLLLVGFGSAFKMLELREGGNAVARLLSGRTLGQDTLDVDERRLINVVEELSIASGLAAPQVVLLDREPSINAFAAGWTENDAVIGVTRGALEQLSRDELQGVLAHEFSHIVHGDSKLNLRLMGVLHGFFWLAGLGYFLWKKGSKIISLILLVLGVFAWLLGKIIKASLGREREFLADAKAVEFTRNPSALANALRKIRSFEDGPHLQSFAAEQASHLFIVEAVEPWHWASTLLATHPPLTERIQRLDASPE